MIAETSLPITERLMPADQNAAAEAVARAAVEGAAVYPIGGGTSLDFGSLPATPGIGLSLGCLNRVIDYPARDLTITVEAGMTMAALAEKLAAEGQRLPIDVPNPERATVGGVVASCLPGPRQYRWGGVRDYVIGLTAIDGAGVPFSAGGRVVKNAAGYDLCRLMCGAMGTLGAIVQVTWMLRPVPETTAWLGCDVPDWDAAERLLAAMVETKTLPSAIELLAGLPLPIEWESGANSLAVARLLVGLEGTQAEVAWMIQQLEEEWHRQGVASSLVLRGAQAEPVWRQLTEFPATLGEDGASPVVQLNVLPGDTAAAVREVIGVDPEAAVLAHAGNGAIVARMSPAAEETLMQRLQRLRRNRKLIVLSSLCTLDRDAVWGLPGPAQSVMQKIKDQFDPQNILNRGRFIFPS